MPDGALSEDLRHYKLVEKYIADNAKNWYEYVESDDCGMPTENGDIRVVVGMDKASSWGMATFENVDSEQPLQFEFRDDGRGSHKWDRIITGRAGPPEEEIRDLLQGPDTSPLRNQCVFVRTLNVSVAGKVRDELAVYEVRASCFRDNFSEFQSRRQTRPGHRNANIQSPLMGQPVSLQLLSSVSNLPTLLNSLGFASIKVFKQIFIRKGLKNRQFECLLRSYPITVSERKGYYHQRLGLDVSHHGGVH